MANNYTLDIGFTAEQLTVLYATRSRVILAKQTEDPQTTVAWQAFQPMQQNRITWEEQYGIYVSASDLVHGAELFQNSATGSCALMNTLYVLGPDGVITNSAEGGYMDTYSLLNDFDQKNFLIAGLYQAATVNGQIFAGNAISATPVLLRSKAIMTPCTKLSVWIQSQVNSNCVVSMIASPMTKLVFGNGTDSIRLAYASETGTFIQV